MYNALNYKIVWNGRMVEVLDGSERMRKNDILIDLPNKGEQFMDVLKICRLSTGKPLLRLTKNEAMWLKNVLAFAYRNHQL